MSNKTDEYYKKYRYLIWRDDIGFLELETFSTEDLERFVENISLYLKKAKEDSEYIIISDQ